MIKRRILTDIVTCAGLLGLGFIGFVFALGPAPRDSAAYKFTYIDTDKLKPGSHEIVMFQGTPIIFSKLNDGSVASFVGLSAYSDCHLQYVPPETSEVSCGGGWIDPCHMGAWDNEGKFVEEAKSGHGAVLEDLPPPNMLSWQGNTAVLHP